MGQHTITTDDLHEHEDGRRIEAARTVPFSIDGANYLIDLTDEHYEGMLEAFLRYVSAGRIDDTKAKPLAAAERVAAAKPAEVAVEESAPTAAVEEPRPADAIIPTESTVDSVESNAEPVTPTPEPTAPQATNGVAPLKVIEPLKPGMRVPTSDELDRDARRIIRTWARKRYKELGEKGRLPAYAIEAFYRQLAKAHKQEAEAEALRQQAEPALSAAS